MSRLSISSSFLVYCHLRYSLDGILLNLVKLLLNGRPDQNCKIRNKKVVLKTDSRETILSPFTIRDIGYAISLLKDSKAPGLDNIHHEMIKCFVPTIIMAL